MIEGKVGVGYFGDIVIDDISFILGCGGGIIFLLVMIILVLNICGES